MLRRNRKPRASPTKGGTRLAAFGVARPAGRRSPIPLENPMPMIRVLLVAAALVALPLYTVFAIGEALSQADCITDSCVGCIDDCLDTKE
jgi:hypothetical protein